MKTIVAFPNKAAIETEAAAWMARLDRGALSQQERHALRIWLHKDPGHAPALRDMAGLWSNLDCMALLAELFPPSPEPVQSFWRRVPLQGVIASLLVVGMVATLGPFGHQQTVFQTAAEESGLNEQVYRTRQGERSSITLKDGSLLTLNTQSEATVLIDHHSRFIHLTRGEAHFSVAKDPGRPFVVLAGHGRVKAVGTAFNVRFVDEQVEVLVDEGVVEVMTRLPDDSALESPSTDRPTAIQPARLILKRGGSARYARAITRSEVLPLKKIERRLAWRRGKWMFEGETLAEVLDEVARYSHHEIIITDPYLADLKIGGYFDIGDIDGFMTALEAGFGIQVVREGDRIQLHASEAPENEG